MKRSVIVVGVTTAAALALVGCNGNNTSSSTSSSSTKSSASTGAPASSRGAQEADYTNLLIKATDITAPGDTFTMQAPQQNPGGNTGVAALYANQGDTREIGDTIMILPDASAAATALEGAKSSLGNNVVGTPEPSAVGTGGTVVSGKSPDGSKAVTVLVFTEGKAFTTLEFDSGPDDPVPPEFVTDVGQKQLAAIQSGLAG